MQTKTTQAQDSRPRATYLLPDGTEVQIIFDHGEAQPAQVTFQLENGRVVYATRKTPPANPHEIAARNRKVHSLCNAMDALASGLGLDPWGPHFLRVVEGTTAEGWAQLAKCAGVHAPSETTIALIVAEYRQRPALQRAVVAMRKHGIEPGYDGRLLAGDEPERTRFDFRGEAAQRTVIALASYDATKLRGDT